MKYIKHESIHNLESAISLFEDKSHFELNPWDTMYAIIRIIGYNGDCEILEVYENPEKAELKLKEVQEKYDPVYLMEYMAVMPTEAYHKGIIMSLSKHERNRIAELEVDIESYRRILKDYKEALNVINQDRDNLNQKLDDVVQLFRNHINHKKETSKSPSYNKLESKLNKILEEK